MPSVIATGQGQALQHGHGFGFKVYRLVAALND